MLSLIAAVLLAPVDDTPAWPGFLGANATRVDPESIPVEWSPQKNIAWQAPITGHGQSSPVIYGEYVFVTSCAGPNKESLHVTCLKLSNGSVVWDKAVKSSNPEKNSLYISRAAPTPVVDASHVFAYFESGDVVALTHGGEVAWQVSLTERYGKPLNVFGLSASPVQQRDRIIILIDDDKGRGGPPGSAAPKGEARSYLVAINKASGDTIWKADRTNRTSWSSPAIVPVSGEPVVICSSAGSVDGYDPESGKRLFSFENVGGNTSSTPIPIGDGRFLVGASPGRGEGGDRAEMAKRSNGLMQVTRVDDAWKAEFRWSNPQVTPNFCSPIVHAGHAYWVNRAGAISCINAETGELAYRDRAIACWATPMGLGNRIYVFGQKKGVTSVLAAGPEFRVVAQNKLWDDEPADDSLKFAEPETGDRAAAAARFSGQTTYGAAAVTGSLLIRTGNRVFCIRKTK